VAAAVRMKTLSLSRSSWQEIATCSWTGANPTCP
jgi:hypothetical protein